MTPTITVVIPNRNDSAHLEKCLDSVLDQAISPDQIIVVDDQSTDDSLDIIYRKLSNNPVAKIIVNPTCLGTMGALNEGLKHATSQYVLFLSSNDYLVNGIFDRAKSCIAKADSPGVWSAMVWSVDESGRNRRLYPTPVIAATDIYLPPKKCISLAEAVGHWFTGTTLIYHRETLQSIGGFDATYQGLADLMAALVISSLEGASFSPEPFGFMRIHDGGCMWRTLTNLKSLDAILEKMMSDGRKASPSLFSPRFCDLTKRRIRFTAIRAFRNNEWQSHARSWHGVRYSALCAIAPTLNKYRMLQMALAFLILRPITDAFAIIWYRILGTIYLRFAYISKKE